MNLLLKRISQSYYSTTALMGIKKEDVFLVSFPKSGNTWVKFILLNVLFEAGELNKDISFKSLDETIPEISRDNLLKNWNYKVLPRFIKSHIVYNKLFFKNNRSLLIIRDPRDVMVSYFHYALNTQGFNFNKNFQAFIRHKRFGLEACMLHQVSWQNRASAIVKYEDLKKKGDEILLQAMYKLNIHLEKNLLHKAFENASFANMKKLDQSSKKYKNIHNEGYRFMRKGDERQWHEYFNENDLTYYNNLIKKHKNIYTNYYES